MIKPVAVAWRGLVLVGHYHDGARPAEVTDG
jgi:hypothetical protein